MEEIYKKISKEGFFAIIAIVIIAIIYSISPKIGIALAILVIISGVANMYASGVIKPATTK